MTMAGHVVFSTRLNPADVLVSREVPDWGGASLRSVSIRPTYWHVGLKAFGFFLTLRRNCPMREHGGPTC